MARHVAGTTGAILDVAHMSRRAVRALGRWLEDTEGPVTAPVNAPRLPLIHSHCTPQGLLPGPLRRSRPPALARIAPTRPRS